MTIHKSQRIHTVIHRHFSFISEMNCRDDKHLGHKNFTKTIQVGFFFFYFNLSRVCISLRQIKIWTKTASLSPALHIVFLFIRRQQIRIMLVEHSGRVNSYLNVIILLFITLKPTLASSGKENHFQ